MSEPEVIWTNEVELLPADDGAEPWLQEKLDVPVVWDGDHSNVLGSARVWPTDGRLMAEVALTDAAAVMIRGEDHVALRFGVHGQILRSHTKMGDDHETVDEVKLLAISVSRA